MELTADGAFTSREAGRVVTGTYTLNNRTITLQPASGDPMQGTECDANGFLDPHGSHWSLHKP